MTAHTVSPVRAASLQAPAFFKSWFHEALLAYPPEGLDYTSSTPALLINAIQRCAGPQGLGQGCAYSLHPPGQRPSITRVEKQALSTAEGDYYHLQPFQELETRVNIRNVQRYAMLQGRKRPTNQKKV